MFNCYLKKAIIVIVLNQINENSVNFMDDMDGMDDMDKSVSVTKELRMSYFFFESETVTDLSISSIPSI